MAQEHSEGAVAEAAEAAIHAAAAEVIVKAQRFLDRIDNITTEQFQLGGERQEREALRAALGAYVAAALVREGR